MAEHLLTVWNPIVDANAVKAHVDVLTSPRDYVWWGRVYRMQRSGSDAMSADELAARFGHVQAFRDRMRGDFVLYVTDHRYMHACRASEIVFGDALPESERRFVPSYYARCAVAMWFRVHDVRALSFDALRTLTYAQQTLGAVVDGAMSGPERTMRKYDRRYDPYASVFYRYPLVVEGPATDAVFARAELEKGHARFADAPGVVYPRRVEEAAAELKEAWGETWTGLEDATRILVANARARVPELALGLDPAAAFIYVAKALEHEVCECVLADLQRLADVERTMPSDVADLVKLVDDDGTARDRTLGAAMHVFLKRQVLSKLALADVDAVIRESAFRARFTRLVDLRNAAVHAPGTKRRLGAADFRKALGEVFPADGPGDGRFLFAQVLMMKQAIRARLVEVDGAPARRSWRP